MYSTPYAMGYAQRDTNTYRNPYQPHDPEFIQFAKGWSHRDAQLWNERKLPHA